MAEELLIDMAAGRALLDASAQDAALAQLHNDRVKNEKRYTSRSSCGIR